MKLGRDLLNPSSGLAGSTFSKDIALSNREQTFLFCCFRLAPRIVSHDGESSRRATTPSRVVPASAVTTMEAIHFFGRPAGRECRRNLMCLPPMLLLLLLPSLVLYHIFDAITNEEATSHRRYQAHGTSAA